MPRCPWAKAEPNITYHDQEWGVPVHDDRMLFEFLILEGAQAGLSWSTILNKRENYRKAFSEFDPEKIARYGKRDVARLLKNEGIIRSPAKIAAAINGARAWLEIEDKEPGGFTEFIWKQVNGRMLVNRRKEGETPFVKTAMSETLSKELKARGFNFVGPVIVYAFAQAVGMVNDHAVECFRHAECAKLGAKRR